MDQYSPVIALLGAVALCILLGVGQVGAEEVREIGNRRQLFLDDWIIAETEHVQREQGEVVKHPGNPILRRDRPWDAGRADLYGSAVCDPEHQRIQLFYAANNVFKGHEDRLAYAPA